MPATESRIVSQTNSVHHFLWSSDKVSDMCFTPMCKHCDETNFSSVDLLVSCDGLVRCLSDSATALVKFMSFPFAEFGILGRRENT